MVICKACEWGKTAAYQTYVRIFPQSVAQQITVYQLTQKIRINGDMQGLRMRKNRSIPNVCEDFST